MFETTIGPVKESGTTVYLRPETAQGIFINFKNVLQIARRKPPFGIAQVGKSFRNEITPGNFLFRTREFEQMEMEFFVSPADAEQWYEYWIAERRRWYLDLGLRESHLRVRAHESDELSHYSSGTSDLEYLFPIGWSELEGIANRGDFDLRAHAEHSGTKLEWIGQDERYVPHVIEPAAGADRAALSFLVDAYDEEEVGGEPRVVLRFHPRMAPVKAAILPLIGRTRNGVEVAVAARRAAQALAGRIRRERPDRAAVSPPGRDRNAMGVHDRRPDTRGRHRHGSRPGLAGAGAAADLRRPVVARRRTRAAVGLAEGMRRLALAAPLVLALGAAACGGTKTVTTTTTVTRTVTVTVTVTTESAAPAAPPCNGSALAGTFNVERSAGAGQISYVLRLENTSAEACFVTGLPVALLIDEQGGGLPTNVQPARPGAAAAKIVLEPDAAAVATARFSPDVPGGSEQTDGPASREPSRST